ncbi:hypothetical protein HK104_006274 [Borealophlyctis nickersoniae]|nr:hypothetical protein HK104_006274 [Borealophlyctis nickersoniae]
MNPDSFTFNDEGFEEQTVSSLPRQVAAWSEEQRAEFAYQLLLTVSSSTISSVTNRLLPLLQRDFICLLPSELAIQVLSYTDARTLGRAAQVSHKWKNIAGDNAIWRILYRRNGWTVNEDFLDQWVREGSKAAETVGGRVRRRRGSAAPGVFRMSVDTGQAGSPMDVETANGYEEMDDVDYYDAEAMDEGEITEDDDDVGESTFSTSHMSTGSFNEAWHMAMEEMAGPGRRPSVSAEKLGSPRSVYSDGDLYDEGARHMGKSSRNRFLYGDRHADINWKYIYQQRSQLEHNWREGNYVPKVFSGHQEAIYCLQFDEDKIVSGSRDDTIKIWDMKSGKCRTTLMGHHGSVLCLQYDDRHIVSGSSDSTIMVWDVKTGRSLRTLLGHTESVLNLRFDHDFIISCSKDTTVKIWDLATGELMRTLRGHKAAVNAIQYRNGLVVSASGDRSIKVWDLQTGQQKKNLLGHTRGIACIQFDGNTIVSGSSDKTIKIWDVHTGAQLLTIAGHSDLVRTLQFDAVRIVSGSYDETLKVWDRRTGAQLLDLKNGGHTSRVFKLQFNETKIVSCSQDQRIIVWDFSAGVDTRFFV